jgi:hypothetical protein
VICIDFPRSAIIFLLSFGLSSGRPKADDFTRKGENMKPLMMIGILLIVLGGLALAYQGFNYTHQEKVLDVGPIHATAEKQEHVSIPPPSSVVWHYLVESSSSSLDPEKNPSLKESKCPS